MGLLLDRIGFAESGIPSFDDLPIPFRCVATDMLSGEGIVLSDGSLAQAVRASAAVPGVFVPVEIGGHVLSDGGMVQNIPVETVLAMGADAVIGVELRLPPTDPAQLQTIAGVLSRAVGVMITQNEKRSLALAQAKIIVDMTGFSVTDYSRVKELIELGYKTAASQSTALLPYAIQDEAEWRAYLSARAARKHRAPDKIETVEVIGADSDTDGRLHRRLNKALRGPLDLDKVDTQLTQIAGQGQFDRLGYEGFVQNGVPALRVTTHEKSYGPPFVDLAVNVDGSGVAAFDFSAGARVTFMDVAHAGGEWRNDLLFGSSNLGASEFYQPLGQSRFFVAPYVFASKFARNSFTGLTRVAVFGDERAGGGFDIGYAPGRRSEFRLGYELFEAKLSPLIGSAGLPMSPALPVNSAPVMSGMGRTVRRFPAAVRAWLQPFRACCRVRGSRIPSGNSMRRLPVLCRSAPRLLSSSISPEVRPSADRPAPLKSFHWEDHSVWGRIFPMNLWATTMPTRHSDSGANFTACLNWWEERSTGADGMRPAPRSGRPRPIPDQLWFAVHSISDSLRTPSSAQSVWRAASAPPARAE